MSPQLCKLYIEIINEERNPICLHILGQGLVDQLCEIIRHQEHTIRCLECDINKLNGDMGLLP